MGAPWRQRLAESLFAEWQAAYTQSMVQNQVVQELGERSAEAWKDDPRLLGRWARLLNRCLIEAPDDPNTVAAALAYHAMTLGGQRFLDVDGNTFLPAHGERLTGPFTATERAAYAKRWGQAYPPFLAQALIAVQARHFQPDRVNGEATADLASQWRSLANRRTLALLRLHQRGDVPGWEASPHSPIWADWAPVAMVGLVAARFGASPSRQSAESRALTTFLPYIAPATWQALANQGLVDHWEATWPQSPDLWATWQRLRIAGQTPDRTLEVPLPAPASAFRRPGLRRG
jgi:hypothetical protein